MGAFEYSALDADGRERQGVIEGDTPRQVRQSLREQGMTPLSVDEVSERRRGTGGGQFTLRRGISANDLALVTRQLATLVRAALPLEEALLAVSQQTDKPRVKSTMLAIRSKVMEGHSLASGMAQFPRVFPDLYLATVEAGEHSGHLEEVLDRLADYAENRQETQQQVLLILLYPILLVLIALGIVLFLVTNILPQIVEVFEGRDQPLPMLTRVLIGFSDFIKAGWPFLLLGGAAIGFGAWYLLRLPEPRRRFHGMLLRAPLIAMLVRGLNAARFARTLSILVGSGVPVLDAMRISAQVVTNIPMREAVDDAARRVREGAPISRSLAASRLFPPMTIHLISSGEASGRLESMLERAAQTQEREIQGMVSALMAILQPLVILVMGGLVALIVAGILLPIVEMNQLIG